MTFEEEATALIKRFQYVLPHQELERRVAELHARHGRQVPPPVTGTIRTIDPNDKLKG